MNEEQLIEFVNWLPTAVLEFQNASPDQIVQSLNQMAESEEGQQMLSQLFTAFQESKQTGNSQMFKKGGKMAAFINKYGNGGCVSCKKKEILQGGMVNKMAEKMQGGGDAPKFGSERRKQLINSFNPFQKNNANNSTQRKDITSNTLENLSQPNIVIGPHTGFITADLGNTNGRLTKVSDLLNLPKTLFIPSNQKGGELAAMTSAETANNIGLIPKAQLGNDTTDWHTKSILEVLPQMQFARRRTYGPGFVDEMSAYADSLDNATLGRLIMPNPTSGQQDTTYKRKKTKIRLTYIQ